MPSLPPEDSSSPPYAISPAWCGLFLIVLVLCGQNIGIAQNATGSTIGEKLADLRSRFEINAATSLASVHMQYRAALRKLEREFAVARQYEEAMIVRDERLAIERFDAQTAKAKPESQPGESLDVRTGGRKFIAAQARFSGSASNPDGAIRLASNISGAYWIVSTLDPGAYEVVVTYACSKTVLFEVAEKFFVLECEAAATPSATSFKSQSFGILKISPGLEKIALNATSVTAIAPLHVRSLQLIPVP